MRRLLLPVLLLLFSVACGRKETPVADKPDDLIPREKMVSVLADIHLLEAAIGITNGAAPPMPIMHMGQGPMDAKVPPVIQKQKELGYYDVFKRNGVTREQYDRSMKWYTAHPEELSVLYDDVITELTRRQTVEQASSVKPQPDTTKKK